MTRAVLMAGVFMLLPVGGATGAQARSAPAPVIEPLDVTMEDAGWLETPSALAASSYQEPAVGPMELLPVPSGFSIAGPTPPSATATRTESLATRLRSAPVRGQQRNQKRRYLVTASAIQFNIPVQIDGTRAGNVPIEIGMDRNVSVRLVELLAILKERVDPHLHSWLGSAYGVNSHVSFEQLRSAGIDVRYDAANDIVVMATH